MNKYVSTVMRTGLCISVLAMPALCPAASTVIFSNLGPGSTYNTSNGNVVGNAFDGNLYAEGDSFLETGAAKFAGLEIALSCFFACPDPVTVSLRGGTATQPGVVLESFSVPGASLQTFGSSNAPLVLTSVLDPSLVGGSYYWVTVSADANDSVDWNLNTTFDPSGEALSTDGGTTWFSPSGQTPGAYAVLATIPEPGALSLMLGAGLTLALAMKRRRA